jgi:hypothetical protein
VSKIIVDPNPTFVRKYLFFDFPPLPLPSNKTITRYNTYGDGRIFNFGTLMEIYNIPDKDRKRIKINGKVKSNAYETDIYA